MSSLPSHSLFVFLFAAIAIALLWIPVHVDGQTHNPLINTGPPTGDPSYGLVMVQDDVYTGDHGLLSTTFIGVKLNSQSRAYVEFRAGYWADAQYVLTYNQMMQTDVFIQNSFTASFSSTGTWWMYLAVQNTIDNFDLIQVRIVANTWEGEVTPVFTMPPFSWRHGYPPPGSPLIQGTVGATGTDTGSGADATALSGPIMVTTTHRSASTTTTLWLAPLLVGIIMAALTVPIAIVAYNKGKKAAKPAEATNETETQAQDAEQQQQQIHGENRVQVSCV